MTPGGLMRGLQLSDAMTGRSEPRNRILARIFHEADWIEQWGIGLPKILRLCAEENLPTPEFLDSGSTFTVKIYRPVNESELGRTEQDEAGRSRTKQIEAKPLQDESITKALGLLQNQSSASATEIAQVISLSKSRTNVIIKKMLEAELIEVIGTGYKTRYILKH